MTSIYVGNLAHAATEDDLRDMFSQHGEVSGVNIVSNRETGRPRGFAFVEMPNGNEAANAIQAVNLQDICGRAVTVNEARPKRPERSHRGGGGGRRYR
ncbi:MAG: RNA-binding protein [Pirellulales bacterium]|nr:RNA-binding protein [Pirellulales bacterium]